MASVIQNPSNVDHRLLTRIARGDLAVEFIHADFYAGVSCYNTSVGGGHRPFFIEATWLLQRAIWNDSRHEAQSLPTSTIDIYNGRGSYEPLQTADLPQVQVPESFEVKLFGDGGDLNFVKVQSLQGRFHISIVKLREVKGEANLASAEPLIVDPAFYPRAHAVMPIVMAAVEKDMPTYLDQFSSSGNIHTPLMRKAGMLENITRQYQGKIPLKLNFNTDQRGRFEVNHEERVYSF